MCSNPGAGARAYEWPGKDQRLVFSNLGTFDQAIASFAEANADQAALLAAIKEGGVQVQTDVYMLWAKSCLAIRIVSEEALTQTSISLFVG